MKKLKIFLLIVLSTLMLQYQLHAQDVRLLETKVADILMQMPAKDATQTDKLVQQIYELGDEGLSKIFSMLKAPGEGDDVAARFALTSLARFTSDKGREKEREWVQKNYLNAIKVQPNKDIQAYLINQLNYLAGDEAVDELKTFLGEDFLCEHVVALYLAVRSEKAEQELLKALPLANGKNQIVIVKALGEMKSKQALPEITKLWGSNNFEVQRTVIDAIASIGDPRSDSLLRAAAFKTNFEYEITNAAVTYIKFADNLGANKELVLCKQVCIDIINACSKPQLLHNQVAAMKIYAKYFKTLIMPQLLKNIENPDSSYRMALLMIARPIDDPEFSQKWINRASEVSKPAKADIIYMLGEKGDKSASEFIKTGLADESEKVRHECVWALIKLQGQASVPTLLQHISAGKDIQVTAKALSTQIDEKSLEKVVESLKNAIDLAKPEMIGLIASKSGIRFFEAVYSYTASDNSEIRKSAIISLKNVSSLKDLGKLFELLSKLTEKTEIENIQASIVAALSDAENPETATDLVLKKLETTTSKGKIIPILPYVGSQKALDVLILMFNQNTTDKDAAFTAITGWTNPLACPFLLGICQTGTEDYQNKAFKGYVDLISKSLLPDDQKFLKLQMAVPFARNLTQKKQVITALGDVKTFLSLVYLGNSIDDPDLQQTAIKSAIKVLSPDNEGKLLFTGDIPKTIAQKCMQLVKGQESDYIKESLKKFIEIMPADKGFVSMFNGKDLTGWKAYVADPIALAKMSPKDLAKKQSKANKKVGKNWNVKDGMIVFKGEGNNLLSDREYGDFEMIVNWRITKKGDSGIYLRGSPQVQIWDTSRVDVGAQVGSGGLYNNQKNESKPLKVADNPIGEWNTFRITMIGEKVTVYLNGELVVNNVTLENYWDRNIPIFPKGTIELQAHGTDLAFKDIYVREIADQSVGLTEQEKAEGFVSLFNGKNLDNWVGDKVNYKAEEGKIVISPTKGEGGGNLYTEKEYSNFIFRFEFQLTPAANNGLGIRAPLEGDAAYVGMELQILDNEAPVYKDLKPYQYHGSVYGVIPAKRGFLKPTGEWNTEEVVVQGKNVKVVLNGTVIMEGNIEEASKNGTMDHNQHPGLLRDMGHIGFLGHGSVVMFRNIRIKEL
ncbi:MAG: family 16 glycoside hydrolase [Bacteroidales bacterium]